MLRTATTSAEISEGPCPMADRRAGPESRLSLCAKEAFAALADLALPDLGLRA